MIFCKNRSSSLWGARWKQPLEILTCHVLHSVSSHCFTTLGILLPFSNYYIELIFNYLPIFEAKKCCQAIVKNPSAVRKCIFRSRKKFSTTYAIVLFFLFFFSRPFLENFKFLQNCLYDFHEILHSHSTPKGAPACAKASKSYGWDVRNSQI